MKTSQSSSRKEQARPSALPHCPAPVSVTSRVTPARLL